jgi:hypothetical protein
MRSRNPCVSRSFWFDGERRNALPALTIKAKIGEGELRLQPTTRSVVRHRMKRFLHRDQREGLLENLGAGGTHYFYKTDNIEMAVESGICPIK